MLIIRHIVEQYDPAKGWFWVKDGKDLAVFNTDDEAGKFITDRVAGGDAGTFQISPVLFDGKSYRPVEHYVPEEELFEDDPADAEAVNR
ncbi:MAG: hypothetical protein ISN29_01465 [Gammaproteobacteria bacterium AqS3]|nr:hypothetical protein [Gammaproteobacteria bacterium AqS3]